ncbi:MAG: hypothetical protein ABIH82_05160 [Candidatus Woesearchaeota archaeon]
MNELKRFMLGPFRENLEGLISPYNAEILLNGRLLPVQPENYERALMFAKSFDFGCLEKLYQNALNIEKLVVGQRTKRITLKRLVKQVLAHVFPHDKRFDVRRFDDVILAGYLSGHDFNKIFSWVKEFNKALYGEESPQAKTDILNRFLASEVSAIAFSSMMLYLASGGRQEGHLKTSFPIMDLEYVLRFGTPKCSRFKAIGYDLEDASEQGTRIGSREFVALCEAAEDVTGDYVVRSRLHQGSDGKEYAILIIDEINGTGFLKDTKTTRPLPEEEFENVLYDFSTNIGGGLGFRLIRRLISELASGFIEIHSRTVNGYYANYHSNENVGHVYDSPRNNPGATIIMGTPVKVID